MIISGNDARMCLVNFHGESAHTTLYCKEYTSYSMSLRQVYCCSLMFVLGLQAVRHARIMRRCGIEQVCCSNQVPTSDSGQSSPRLWVPNPYYLSPTRRSNMHFNDKGRMNGCIGNDNRERNERRTYTGGNNITYGVSQLPCLWHEVSIKCFLYVWT